MKKEEIQALFKSFEDAVCTIEETECWSARELRKLLGYKLWQNFTNVITKAKEACTNVGNIVDDHFIDVNKMIMNSMGTVLNESSLTRNRPVWVLIKKTSADFGLYFKFIYLFY